MQRIDDERLWLQAWLDTRFLPEPGRTELREGVHVKSKEREGGQGRGRGWPKFYGIVVTYNKKMNVALVRSGSDEAGGPSPRGTVWRGTIAECDAMWEVD